MNLMELFVKIGADTSGLDSGLSEAESKSTSLAKKLGGGLKTAAKVGAVAVAAIGTAAVATTKYIVKGASEVAEYGDNIDKMSQKMGISAQAYQEWDAIMKHSGTTIDALKPSMKTLATQAEKGSDAFQKLGISEAEVANLSQEDLFAKVITGLQNMEEGTERTYITSQLLGRGATELGALLNTSAEETENMRQKVHELGGVMSDEAVKAAAAFQDSLQDMQTGFSALKRNLFSDFLPSITTVMNGLTDIFTGNQEIGLEKISEGVDEFIDNLSNSVPKILELGATIITSLGDAIIENQPQLFESALEIVSSIGSHIIDNLPLITETGMQITLTLAQGLTESLPTLIPTIVNVILQIYETLLDNSDLLIDASLQLIIALAEGLIQALPVLISKAPEIVLKLTEATIQAAPYILKAGVELILTLIQGIVDTFGSLVQTGYDSVDQVKSGFMSKISEARTWGSDMIGNFIAGIKEKWEALKGSVVGIGQMIKDNLGHSHPKEGPLADDYTWMPDMMDLFTQGIKDNEGKLRAQLTSSIDFSDIAVAPAYAGVETSGRSNQENPYNDIMATLSDALSQMTLQVLIGGNQLDAVINNVMTKSKYRSGGR